MRSEGFGEHITDKTCPILPEVSFPKFYFGEFQSRQATDDGFGEQCARPQWPMTSPPKKFGGKKELFEEFSYKLKAYFSLINPG